jgi:hypothetical protein
MSAAVRERAISVERTGQGDRIRVWAVSGGSGGVHHGPAPREPGGYRHDLASAVVRSQTLIQAVALTLPPTPPPAWGGGATSAWAEVSPVAVGAVGSLTVCPSALAAAAICLASDCNAAAPPLCDTMVLYLFTS